MQMNYKEQCNANDFIPFLPLFFSFLFLSSSFLVLSLSFPLLLSFCLSPSPGFAISSSACLGNSRNLLELLVLVSKIWKSGRPEKYMSFFKIKRIQEFLLIKVKFNLRGPNLFFLDQSKKTLHIWSCP